MPVRILHTSDWHLGHQLHELERADEHQAFLTWLLDTAEAQNVDALLITGDIFDHSQPPASAQQMWYHFLVAAHQRLPRAQIIAIAGNHDSPLRLRVAHAFEQALGRLHVIGTLQDALALDGNRPVGAIAVDAADGSGRAWVLAAPFLRGADIGIDDVHGQAQQAYSGFLDLAAPWISATDAVLLTGHAYVVGGQLSQLSERMLSRGNQGAWPTGVFGDVAAAEPLQVQGVALGHLHKPQQVLQNRVWYAGSPIPLALDEASYPHRALVVELQGKCAPTLVNLPIPRHTAILQLPNGSDFAPLPEILQLLAALPLAAARPDEPLPLCEVRVALDGPVADLLAQLQAACAGKHVRLVKISRKQAQVGTGRVLRQLGELQPIVLARGLFRGGMPGDGSDPDLLEGEAESALGALVTWAQMAEDEVVAERNARLASIRAEIARASQTRGAA